MAAGIHKLTLLLLCGLVVAGCKTISPFDSRAEYQRAEARFESGDLRQALLLADHALSRISSSDVNTLWQFRLLKAEILIWQGLSKNALALLTQQGLTPPTADNLLARRCVLVGIAQSSLQQLDFAERTLTQARQMRGADSPEVMGDLLLCEGKIAVLRRNMPQAELRFKEALQLAQAHGHAFLAGKALGNLGMLQMQQHRYADAVDEFNAALVVAQRLGEQASIVKTTGNLGWAYSQMGDLDRAADLFRQWETKSAQLGMLADQEAALMNIAGLDLVKRDYDSAEKNYHQALELARRLNNQQDVAFGLTDLALTAIHRKQFDLAQSYNQEALKVEQSIGDHETELYSNLNQSLIASGKQDTATAQRLASDVIEHAGSNYTLRAEALSELAKVDVRLDHVQVANAHYQAALQSLEKGRTSLGREEFELSYPTNGKGIYNDYIDFLVDQGSSDQAFSVAELHRARTLTEGLVLQRDLRAQSVSVETTRRAALHLQRVILSYWLGPEKSYLWLFWPGGSHLVTLPGEDQIRPKAERYRAHLTGTFQSQEIANSDGEDLYRILIGPAERYLKPESQVTIIPDGVLCGLNFETFIVSSPKPHYWIEDASITNASSAILLSPSIHTAQRSSSTPKMLLLIGNPKQPGYYPSLAHAGDEIGLVRGHFSPADETVISGADATPAAYFKTKPESYAFIHFVAHGTASRVSPLDSAVVLSEDGTSHNLYARDIAASRLHARLVTISACDSAGARIYSSEGLVGLSWAFLRAGAQRVIAALWEVNDASTPQLMNRLYSGIVAGEDPAFALRAAKLELLHSKGVQRRPFYWAPFVLYEGI